MTVTKIYQILHDAYGDSGWWPLLKNIDSKWVSVYSKEISNKIKNEYEQLEIALGAILTQNTTWNNAQKALINLKVNGLIDIDNIISTDNGIIADLIKSSGYYNQKTLKIKEYARFIRNSGSINRSSLLTIKGIGPETADDILLYGFDQPFFVVDAYTKRLFVRLGIINDGKSSYDLIQTIVQKEINDLYILKDFHGLIVTHAKKHCRSKPDCIGCPFFEICKNK